MVTSSHVADVGRGRPQHFSKGGWVEGGWVSCFTRSSERNAHFWVGKREVGFSVLRLARLDGHRAPVITKNPAPRRPQGCGANPP